MPAAGDPIYASDVTRARTKWYWDSQTTALPASSSAVDVPGISISFTTEVAGADCVIWWTMDADPQSAGATSLISSRPRITDPTAATTDGAVFAVYGGGAATTDRGSPGNAWKTTLGAAGTYTVTLKATTGANQQIFAYSTLTVAVQEQFS